jgi:hypothetical protein
MSDANLGGGVNNCIDLAQIVFRLNYVPELQRTGTVYLGPVSQVWDTLSGYAKKGQG